MHVRRGVEPTTSLKQYCEICSAIMAQYATLTVMRYQGTADRRPVTLITVSSAALSYVFTFHLASITIVILNIT